MGNIFNIYVQIYIHINNLIQNYEWSEMFEMTDSNKATRYFTKTIISLKKQVSSEISFNSKTKKIKPWATTALINSISRRNHLHTQVRKHPLNLKLKDFYLKFKKQINIFNKSNQN